jgi:hypothetical protein
MRQDKLDLAIKVSEKVLNETVTSDIAPFTSLLSDIIYKTYSKSLVGDIADVKPLTTPVGKIGTLYSVFTANVDLNTDKRNIKVLKIDNTNGYSIGDTISTSTGSAKILFMESEGDLLIELISGHFNNAQVTNENSANVISVITNRTYASRIFESYSNPTTGTNEHLNPRELSFEMKFNNIETVSRKLKSVLTSEAIDDLRNTYGVEIANQFIIKEFASEIIYEIDMEVINYMKKIATPAPDLILTNSYGLQGDIMAVGNDIYANVFKNAMQIAKDTKRIQNFFVLGDAASLALLMTNPLHVSPETEKNNVYYMGKLGEQYSLYLDPFATENYILIGYTNKYSEIGDSGLIYAPYSINTVEVPNSESGISNFHHIIRYGYTSHPQDTGTGEADSIFFRMFKVDMTDIRNLTVY